MSVTLASEYEEESQSANQTFAINTANYTIGGKIDDLEALQQSIYLLLSIEADQYIIYPHTYGIVTVDLIGKPNYYVAAVLPERIKTALMQDDRIVDVTDFEFGAKGRTLEVQFTINTIYGDYTAGSGDGNYISQLPPVEISLGEIELKLNSILAIQNYYINGGAE